MYIERLRHIYFKIRKSHLVQNKSTDVRALSHIEDLLNESLPTNAVEAEIKNTIRKLYYTNREGFLELIEKNPYFILFTDVKDIVTHFNLNYVIFIRYQQSYKVSLYLTNSLRV